VRSPASPIAPSLDALISSRGWDTPSPTPPHEPSGFPTRHYRHASPHHAHTHSHPLSLLLASSGTRSRADTQHRTPVATRRCQAWMSTSCAPGSQRHTLLVRASPMRRNLMRHLPERSRLRHKLVLHDQTILTSPRTSSCTRITRNNLALLLRYIQQQLTNRRRLCISSQSICP